MRKLLSIALALSAFLCAAQPKAERTYLMTDRDWYAAGEGIFVSAFCLDVAGEKPVLSSFSGVAYVELTSASGVAIEGKIALFEGRGAGRIMLPRTLPTGNYRLSAYTALSRNEPGYDPRCGSRIISVYNTLSSSRVPGGIRSEALPESPARPNTGPLEVSVQADGSLVLQSPADASLSVSIHRQEDLPSYSTVSLADALAPATEPRSSEAIPEYDGEIISLRICQRDGSPMPESDFPEVFIARPGRPEELYSNTLQPDGYVRFFTFNTFGSGELVVSLRKGMPDFQVEVESPFAGLEPGDIPPLVVNPSLSHTLSQLGTRMQLSAAFEADTLFQHLPVREIPFVGEDVIRYNLDDYTRFATFQEVFTEYLFDIKARRSGEEVELQVRCRDRIGSNPYFGDLPSLILIDGVPVMDHSLIYKLDPALVKRIDIYPYRYAPYYVYSGLANFVTFKGNMGGLRLGQNVRMVEFQGPSWPMAYTPSHKVNDPSVRETLLWQPLVQLKAGESLALPAPDAPEGRVLQVEGISTDGAPIFYRLAF